MHDEVIQFTREMVRQFPDHARGCVLEIGSLVINGSVRYEFPKAMMYLGVDVQSGEGVDLVGLGHEIDLPKKDFDVLVCTEVLEHDPYWWASLLNGYKHLRSGGIIIMTCAGPNRAPHNVDDSPTPGYYANVTAKQMEAWATAVAGLNDFEARQIRGDMDTHFWAVKS